MTLKCKIGIAIVIHKIYRLLVLDLDYGGDGAILTSELYSIPLEQTIYHHLPQNLNLPIYFSNIIFPRLNFSLD